jgi:hypothetical protein
MADYYPLIARAVAGLEKNSGEARRALYERARTALVAQLRGVQPALSETDITRERLALEEAIRKVEAEAGPRGPARPPAPPPRPSVSAPMSAPLPEPAAAPAKPAASAAAPTRYPPPPPKPAPAPAPPPPTAAPPPRSMPASMPSARIPVPEETAPFAGSAPEPEVTLQAPVAPPPEPPPSPQPRSSLTEEALKGFRGEAPPPPVLDERPAPEARLRPPRPPAEPRMPGRLRNRDPFADRNEPRDLDAGLIRAPAALEPESLAPEAQPEWDPYDGAPFDEVAERAPPPPSARRPRMPRAVREEPEEGYARPRRSIAGIIQIAITLFLVLALGIFVYWQRHTITGLYQALRGQPAQVSRDAPATQTRPKIADRVGAPGQATSPSQQAGPAVAQRVVLYEEEPSDPQGKRYVGSAVWRTEMVSPGAGQPQELAVRADIEIPERKLNLKFTIRRNTDPTLPASHTIELLFNLPQDFAGGGITNVPGILMKQAEQTRGVPLSGLAVKVTTGFFLIGLSSVEADMQRNIQLLKERGWFDIPIVYNNNRRAILAIEKGTPGERAFAEAFAAWKQ